MRLIRIVKPAGRCRYDAAVTRRTQGRMAVSALSTILAVFVSLAPPAAAGTATARPVKQYTLRSAKAHCRAHYVKKARWVKRRNKRRELATVKRTVCVLKAPVRQHCKAGYLK